MKIQDIFILKDGLPIYHHKQQDSKLKETVDDTLITGFLHAIINFTKETGLGIPTYYITKMIKFSFFEQNDFLFIVCCDPSIPDSRINKLFVKLSSSFLNQIGEQIKSFTVSQIDNIINLILKDLQQKENSLLKPLKEISCNDIYFKEVIPKRHVDNKDNIRNSRRKLFKLIDGKNSIYDLAMHTNSHPLKILSILRSYKKEGIISF